ncbi:MAG: hypothetical protein IT438_04065 [Phycisphaerales bacterium]|nr:hypothetical protein [Phycisphaerales bacterium]
MRRGQNSSSTNNPTAGWTKQELMAAVDVSESGGGGRRPGLSPKTFDLIRKAARVKGPSHGGLTWVFSADDVAAMIRCAEGGRFTERGEPVAQAWRKLLSERGVELAPSNRRARSTAPPPE